jgi:uncharacterized protein (DUF1501 family)
MEHNMTDGETPLPSRRELLRHGVAAGASLALLAGMPGLRPLFADRLAVRGAGGHRVLVVVQLSGGNDGLSTVIPYADDLYHKARRQTRHDPAKVLKIDQLAGLHPDLRGVRALYEKGSAAIVQGVSYPTPQRSHFESMDIWHTADMRGAAEPYGWIGRYADSALAALDDPNIIVNVGNAAPRAIFGKVKKPIAFSNPDSYRYVAKPDQYDPYGELQKPKASGEVRNIDFVRRVAASANASSAAIRRAIRGYQPRASYGQERFAQDLMWTAAVIAAGLETRVVYVTLGGFDTHTAQKGTHDALMRQLDRGLTAFHEDLAAGGHDDRVMTMVFSEFGRRVQENGSGGTDHGVAAPMFLFGKHVKGGLYGRQPSLADLDRGDLKMQVDFRAVYATVLDQWMSADPQAVLREEFKAVGRLVKS